MKFFNKSNILFLPFVILTGSIVILCLLTQVLINLSLDDINSDTKTINAVTKERILTQQIVNELAADNLGGILTGVPMDTLSQIFLANHIAILKGNSAENLKPLEEVFMPEYKVMDKSFREFNAYADFIATSDNNNKAFVILLNKQEAYLKTVDALILRIDNYSKIEIKRFQEKELLIMLASLLIIFAEVIFIFFPAIKRLKKQSRQFRDIAFYHSHIIRQPLTNIMGLLNIIDSSTVDAETKELLNMVNKEAEKLDDIKKAQFTQRLKIIKRT